MTSLTVTINGSAHGPREVRDDLTMNDFLREYVGMTGTKFGCGAGQCLSCAIIVDNRDGSSYTSPTCIVPAINFNGKSIRTVEGHAKNGELTALQKAFITHFAFQCGYCTPGFLNEGQVLLERLARTRIARADLEKTIGDALDGHLCRCTGYVKYHEAVRVEVERETGALRIAKAYSVLECGQALAPEIVLGQAQGGFAMGVGYALLETLPLYEDGPGNGKCNLGQYLVARGSDLPLRDLEIEILPPVDANERPKGMAEVVMIPVVPALLNAIFDATGRRFQSLPVTQAMIREAALAGAPK